MLIFVFLKKGFWVGGVGVGVHICTVLGFGIHFSPPTKMNAGRPVSVNGATDILEGVLKRKAAQEGTTLEQQHKLRKAIYEKIKRTVKATAAVDEDRRVALLNEFDLKSMSTSFIKEVLNQHPTLLESLKECILTLDLSQVIVKPRKVKDEQGDTNVDEDTATSAGGGGDGGVASADDNYAPPVATGAQEIGVGQKRKREEMESVTLNDLQCPIGMELMEDPVIAADGHTYERSEIHEWLWVKGNNTSPLTREELANKTLIPNHTLKKIIREHKEKTLHLSGSGGGSSA